MDLAVSSTEERTQGINFIERIMNATWKQVAYFYLSMRSSNINPKEKGKKESAFRGDGFFECKVFGKNNFLGERHESAL